MKKFLFIIVLGCAIASCGNNTSDKKDTAAADSTASKPAAANDPDISKGLTLVANNDCLTCHKISEQLTGPAYEAVAERYASSPGAVDTLANKVISGGAGHWGSIPMSPHPNLSKEDATAMVKYILSLKKS